MNTVNCRENACFGDVYFSLLNVDVKGLLV